MAKVTPKAKPDFNVYTVVEQEGKDPFWLKIGAAWANKDGKGYSITLQALPLDGRLVLREWKEPEKS